MDAVTFAVRARGSSHVLFNKICQDSAKCFSDDICCIISAADGHGAAPYFRSHIGSKYAANCAVKNLKRFMHHADEIKKKNPEKYSDFVKNISKDGGCEKTVRKLFEKILNDWLKMVYRDIEKHPFMLHEYEFLPKEFKAVFEGDEPEFYKAAYGTTLVCAAVCDDFWIGMQLGDGDCTSLYGSKSRQDIPPDSSEFDKGFTYSMCSYDAVQKMRYTVSTKIPDAVFVYTDGITNSLDNNEIELFLNEAAEDTAAAAKQSGSEAAMQNCCRTLRKKLYRISDDGCGDDVSAAGIISKGFI